MNDVDDRPGADFTRCPGHPTCPAGYGGDHDHDDLAEVWCRQCVEPATRVVNGDAFCAPHGELHHHKLFSRNFNGGTRR